MTLGRWALTLLTGLSVGLIAYGSIHAIDWITRIKIDMLESAAAGSGGSRFSGRDWGALINFMLFNLMCAPPVFVPYTCQYKNVFPFILCERPQVRLDGHLCAVHDVTCMLRSVCLTYLRLCYAG